MVDYSKLTTEAFENKINSSSDRVKKFFNSEEFVKRVSEISDAHNLDLIEREYLAFNKLAAATILGLINPSELLEEILKFIDTDTETAASATRDIKELIEKLSNTKSEKSDETVKPKEKEEIQTTNAQGHLEELEKSAKTQTQESNLEKPDFSKTSESSETLGSAPKQIPGIKPGKIENFSEQQADTANANQSTLEKAPEQVYKESENTSDKLKPQQTKEGEESKTPFVLQEEDEVKSNIETDVEASKPIRASFYKPKASPKTKEEDNTPATAKIELGNKEEEPKKGDYVVHLPNDAPKETGPVRENSESEKPEESNNNDQVHPENVVDLKDLPK